jgi:hypothetical protein
MEFQNIKSFTMRLLSLLPILLSTAVASPLIQPESNLLDVRDPQGPNPTSPGGPGSPTSLNPTTPGGPGSLTVTTPTTPGGPGSPTTTPPMTPGGPSDPTDPSPNPTSTGLPGDGGGGVVPPTLNPTLPGFPGGGPTLPTGPLPTRTLGPLPPSTPPPSTPSGPVSPCDGNTADTRSQWCDYSIDTDYANIVPNTGRTREYWLTITEVTVAPDGVCKCTAMEIVIV